MGWLAMFQFLAMPLSLDIHSQQYYWMSNIHKTQLLINLFLVKVTGQLQQLLTLSLMPTMYLSEFRDISDEES